MGAFQASTSYKIIMSTNTITESTVFKALTVYEEDGYYRSRISEKMISDLPAGEVLIKVHFSSINYKDALSSMGNKGVTPSYPHTPGVDAAGVVLSSSDPTFQAGDQVVVTGSDFGMSRSGGFQEYIRVPATLPIKLPPQISLRKSMEYGTAGLTAAMCAYKIIEKHGVKPEDGNVLVTGASGGVGSCAVQLLSKLGYKVYASTGKLEERDLLKRLGAFEVIDRSEIDDKTDKLLRAPKWRATVDSVGGNTLATVLKTTESEGCVAACGNVAGGELHTSVFPFILRGVTLYGVDSVGCPTDYRRQMWNRLADDWEIPTVPELYRTISLQVIPEVLQEILNGKIKGRVVVEL